MVTSKRASSNGLAFLLSASACLGAISVGCSAKSDDPDTTEDELREIFGQSEFEIAPTFHPGEAVMDNLEKVKGVIAHPLFIGADEAHPVVLNLHAIGAGDFKKDAPCPDNCAAVMQEEMPLKVAVLSPANRKGRRKTLLTKESTYGFAELRAAFTEPGQYLIVVGSLSGKRGRIQLNAEVKKGEELTGAIVSPLAGALTGRSLSVRLNSALPDASRVELWASPPLLPQGTPKRLIAEGISLEHMVTFSITAEQAIAGDDLNIVVPADASVSGAIPFDSGTRIRLWESDKPGVRLDRLGVTIDHQTIDFSISGVTEARTWQVYYGGNEPDGYTSLALRSLDRRENGAPLFLGYASSDYVSSRCPGQTGSLGLFDETISVPQGNKLTPTTGEILSVSSIHHRPNDLSEAHPSYTVLGCFKFDPYAPEPVACPTK